MIVLGIETSCDETAAAVVAHDGKVLSNVVSSQVEIHARFGGVVPEIASRNHLQALPNIIEQALQQAELTLERIDGIAVTARPGLIGALLVGVQAAKALAWSLDLPFVGIHHLEAHIYAAHVPPQSPPAYPYLALVVSGGHTSLFDVRGVGDLTLLGSTRDDAAGEAFDKVAKLLGLGYPGGPVIDRLAQKGDPNRYQFPAALLRRDTLDFSFSGLKTAVRTFVEANPPQTEQDVADLCASVQAAIVRALTKKIEFALERTGYTTLVVSGGVAANSGLRAALEALAETHNLSLHLPPLWLCTDNAAMVAALGKVYLERGVHSTLSLNAEPYRPLGVEGIPAAGD